MRQLTLDVQLPDLATFGNFVSGDNAEVVDAVRRHAESRPDPVLWLRGPADVGKSHLLAAACNLLRAAGGKVAFLSGAGAAQATPAATDGWSSLHLVAIDNIDAIAGHREWEKTLFAVFNQLRDAHGAMLVASRSGPRDVEFALPDLASRLASGPVYQLRPISDGDRLAALRARAQQRGFELPEETGRFLMYRVPRDLSSLFDLLDHLDVAALRAQRRLTIPFVRQILQSRQGSEDLEN
ncbi:MAG: DnaA regulatory inactivator Hda [Gammaproteobacteria bacterium]|nr:DnaA regulatory inactivator Hda [Gammaproteobacteria bacterium]